MFTVSYPFHSFTHSSIYLSGFITQQRTDRYSSKWSYVHFSITKLFSCKKSSTISFLPRIPFNLDHSLSESHYKMTRIYEEWNPLDCLCGVLVSTIHFISIFLLSCSTICCIIFLLKSYYKQKMINYFYEWT